MCFKVYEWSADLHLRWDGPISSGHSDENALMLGEVGRMRNGVVRLGRGPHFLEHFGRYSLGNPTRWMSCDIQVLFPRSYKDCAY